MIRTFSLAFASMLALSLSAPLPVQAAWPEHPVKLVVPYPAGGNVDVAARIIGERMQALLGQPVVVEDRPGVGGLIAGEYVAHAPPDGYTLFVGANGPILFAPELAGKHAYEWRRDFIPISTISITPIVLQVHPSIKANTLAEFLDLVKREPGKLNMASPGIGTSNHLMSELAQSRLGLSWVTVQYKGNAPATNDLIAGNVQFNFDQVSVALPFIRDGKTRALAVTGDTRMASMPDVPTFKEAGHPEIEGVTFTGLLAPTGTPDAVVTKLAETLAEVLADPDVKAKFEGLGAQTLATSRDAFTAYLQKEDDTWMPIIRAGNIRVQ